MQPFSTSFTAGSACCCRAFPEGAVSSSDTLITLGQAFTEQEIKAVIKRCRLEDFVNSLPDGLDTMIKEKYIIARTEIR